MLNVVHTKKNAGHDMVYVSRWKAEFSLYDAININKSEYTIRKSDVQIEMYHVETWGGYEI